MFTRKSHPVTAPVAIPAMPFPPVSTTPAYFAMPTAIVLHYFLPAERIPIDFITFTTTVMAT
jgi:hypothetical protein